jgi:general secretion pathway protein E
MNDRNVGEHRLTLAEVLDWMVEDSWLTAHGRCLKSERRLHGARSIR